MTDIEQILLNRVKFIGDGEWKLSGTPQELIDEISRLIIEARIDELKHIDDPVNVRLWFDGFYGVDDRIKSLSNNLSKGDGDG